MQHQNKYLTQKNRYSCGAVALINLFKKMNIGSFKLKDVQNINRHIRTDPKEGTEDVFLVKFLRQKKLISRSINSIRYEGLRRYLKNGYEIIATIETPFYNHYATVVDFDSEGVYFSNCFTWSDMQKDNQSVKLLKKVVYWKNQDIKKICTLKDHDLSMIFVRKP